MFTSPKSSAEPITANIPAELIAAEESFARFALALMRVAHLQAQLAANEIAATGIALKSGWIDADTALAMLGEAGLHLTEPSSGAA